MLLRPHTVVSIRILTESDGRSRGIALARLLTHEAALEAKTSLHGMRFPEGETLVVRFADSETQRKLKRCVLGPTVSPIQGDKNLLGSSSSGHGHGGGESREYGCIPGRPRFIELSGRLSPFDDHPRPPLRSESLDGTRTDLPWSLAGTERFGPLGPPSKELFSADFV